MTALRTPNTMTGLHLLSTWAVGIFNGCAKNEHPVPSSLTYGMLTLASGVQILQSVGPLSNAAKPPRPYGMAGIVATAPMIVGSIFGSGFLFGRTVRYLEDEGAKRGGVRIRFSP